MEDVEEFVESVDLSVSVKLGRVSVVRFSDGGGKEDQLQLVDVEGMTLLGRGVSSRKVFGNQQTMFGGAERRG